MHESELWITKIFNDYLAGAGNAILSLAGVHSEHPARPWANFVTMPLVMPRIIVDLFALLRARHSVDKPGNAQHVVRVVYAVLDVPSEERVGPHGHLYVAYFDTIFILCAFWNVTGVGMGFESVRSSSSVPVGC